VITQGRDGYFTVYSTVPYCTVQGGHPFNACTVVIRGGSAHAAPINWRAAFVMKQRCQATCWRKLCSWTLICVCGKAKRRHTALQSTRIFQEDHGLLVGGKENGPLFARAAMSDACAPTGAPLRLKQRRSHPATQGLQQRPHAQATDGQSRLYPTRGVPLGQTRPFGQPGELEELTHAPRHRIVALTTQSPVRLELFGESSISHRHAWWLANQLEKGTKLGGRLEVLEVLRGVDRLRPDMLW